MARHGGDHGAPKAPEVAKPEAWSVEAQAPAPAAPARAPAAAPEAPEVAKPRATTQRARPPQPGWKRCKAIGQCLVRGMPKYPGEEFWLDGEQADRLEGKGQLEIL